MIEIEKGAVKPFSTIDAAAVQVARTGAVATIVLLASLHLLSPEFDPAWRMVSEYANGHYAWVLSLMFAAWGLSTLALAVALRSAATTTSFRVGLVALVLAGVGEAMAAVFDINHDLLHGIAGALGMLGLPLAAMLVSARVANVEPWSRRKRRLLLTANLTWVSLVVLAGTFVLMTATFMRVYGSLPSQPPLVLPAGVIGLVGWANRLLVVLFCGWAIAAAEPVVQRRDQLTPSGHLAAEDLDSQNEANPRLAHVSNGSR